MLVFNIIGLIFGLVLLALILMAKQEERRQEKEKAQTKKTL